MAAPRVIGRIGTRATLAGGIALQGAGFATLLGLGTQRAWLALVLGLGTQGSCLTWLLDLGPRIAQDGSGEFRATLRRLPS